MKYYKSLFRGKLEREPSMVWNVLVSCCCYLHPKEVYEDIKKAYKEFLVDPCFINLKEVEEYLDMNQDEIFYKLKNDVHYKFIDDTISDMEWWACFQPEKKVKTKPLKSLSTKAKSKKRKKIGRNDPCPCGSGKKYKKCCGSVVNR